MTMVRFEKFVAASPSVLDEGPGVIKGYASVFDVIDRQGEVVLKGAFKRTILERIAAGKVFLTNKHMSQGATAKDTIGVIRGAVEDDYGLLFEAPLYETDAAQEGRRQAATSNMGFSIGGEARYETIKKDGRLVPALVEVKLDEITMTPFPANDDARVVTVKSLNGTPETVDDPPPALPEEPLAPVDMAPETALLVAKAQAWLVQTQIENTLKELEQ